jgi:hypothetical protein
LAQVAALTGGELKAMFLTRLNIVTAAALLAALLGGASGGIALALATGQPAEVKRVEKNEPPPGGKGHEENPQEVLAPRTTMKQNPNQGMQKGPEKAEAARAEVLTPEQAIRLRPNKKVTVEFKVSRARVYGNLADSRGEDRRDVYLTRDVVGVDDDRFYVRISGKAAQLRRLGLTPRRWGGPADDVPHFAGKVIRVTGQVVASDRPAGVFRSSTEAGGPGRRHYLLVEDLDQLEVVR